MERDTKKPVSNDLQKNVLKVIHHRVVVLYSNFSRMLMMSILACLMMVTSIIFEIEKSS